MIYPWAQSFWTRRTTAIVAVFMALVLLGGGIQGAPDFLGVVIGVIAVVWAGRMAYNQVRGEPKG